MHSTSPTRQSPAPTWQVLYPLFCTQPPVVNASSHSEIHEVRQVTHFKRLRSGFKLGHNVHLLNSVSNENRI